MLMSMLSHVLSAWFAFLLPSYATWKALAHRPLSEPELERWGQYWAVVGAFVAVEYVTGWILDWIPFYWEARTLFLLFLALPQTQGSSWVYTTYLQPFLLKNQADIDAGLAAAQTNALAFVQSRVQVFWQTFWALATRASAAQPAPGQQQQPAAGGNAVEMARSLWASYGSSLLGAFQQAARPATGAQPGVASASARAASAPARPAPSPAATPYDIGSSTSVQVNQNAFSAEMVSGFSPEPAAHAAAPPPFPEPEVPAA